MDVDDWLCELGPEQLTEWEAYFALMEKPTEPPIPVQSQEEIANTLLKIQS